MAGDTRGLNVLWGLGFRVWVLGFGFRFDTLPPLSPAGSFRPRDGVGWEGERHFIGQASGEEGREEGRGGGQKTQKKKNRGVGENTWFHFPKRHASQ